MNGFLNDRNMCGGYKGKGGKDTGKGWSANGVWEEDVWEDGSDALTMQHFGVTDDHEQVLNKASSHAERTARVVSKAPLGRQLQNRFSDLAVEDEDSDEEEGIPIKASLNLDPEINHLKHGPRLVKLETVGLQCSSGDGTVSAKTGV